ncbi:hypothetical protein JCM8547_003194 [Rhodosporidiobolus lusitaniae]
MQAAASAIKQATARPSRAAAVAARTLASAALASNPRDRSSRSPSSSLSPPPPSPPGDKDNYKAIDHADGGGDGDEDVKPVKEKKKRAPRKPKEPVVYVIPDVERLETNYKGRLGYACLNTILRKQKPNPIFCSRTCRIDTIKKEDKGMPYLKELGRQNMEDLTTLIEWNAAHHIFFMRMSSEMFPFAAHPDYQYSLDYAEKELKKAGETANRLGVRLTTHPGQFTQLGSPRRQVVENAYRDLEYHNEMMDRMGLGKDSVMIIHGGGVYGDKDAAIKRFKQNYQELSQGVKNRLVLENDEICFNVDDLLPICEELNIPLVFDYHHDWIFPSSQTPTELMPRILATWTRKGIKPKFHLSEPRKGAETIMEKRAHADRCQRLPDPLPEDVDLMIEAKDKEQAVFHLFRIYNLHPVIHEDLRPPAQEETKQTARGAANKERRERKKAKDAAAAAASSADEATDASITTAGGGETDGTLPPSSPTSANIELGEQGQEEQEREAQEEGLMPLPEGVGAEGQEYCPPVDKGKKGKGKKKEGGETPEKKKAMPRKKKVKSEEEGEEGGEKKKTPRKRKSAGGESAEGDGAEDGAEEKPKKKRKTPVKEAAAAVVAAVMGSSAGEGGEEEEHKPKKHKKHHGHHHHKHHANDKDGEAVGVMEEVAMEVAKK